jgi:hypothetical protein
MPKPPRRAPEAGSTAAAAPEASVVAPAPNNGIPFGERPPSGGSRVAADVKHNRRQLGARIPEELYDRLVRCSEGECIPQGRLLERALRAELQRLGY